MNQEMQKPDLGYSHNITPGLAHVAENSSGIVSIKKHRSRKQASEVSSEVVIGNGPDGTVVPERRPRKSRKVKPVESADGTLCTDDQLFGTPSVAVSGSKSLLKEKSSRLSGSPVDMFRISTPAISGEVGMYKFLSHSKYVVLFLTCPSAIVGFHRWNIQ